jgi:demethylmenaquinone methyltransferase/2-methoxy-6-polyprenyl-1,4-benzoquinol methylase
LEYDRLNTLMSLGVDGRWRRRALDETRLHPGDAAVDACSGSGRMSALLAEQVGPFGRVEGVDVSGAMVAQASDDHHAMVQAHFRVADVLELPFDDGEFDAAVICFGLRNLSDRLGALRELTRVLRPGGRLVCLELSLPTGRMWRGIYRTTFQHGSPIVGRVAGVRPEAVRSVPSLDERFPTPDQIAAWMREAGLTDVRQVSLGTGIASLHRGTAPATDASRGAVESPATRVATG